jgi:hypothetical protein
MAASVAFVIDASALRELPDGGALAPASACRDAAFAGAHAIDVAFPATAFLVEPRRAITAGHALSFRDPRGLRLLFAHDVPAMVDHGQAWYCFAPEHVARVERIEFLDTRPHRADLALLRLAYGPRGLAVEPVHLASADAISARAVVGMIAHPHGLPRCIIDHDAAGQVACIESCDGGQLSARMQAWRGCSGAPWCTAQGVIGVQSRRDGVWAFAQGGLRALLR